MLSSILPFLCEKAKVDIDSFYAFRIPKLVRTVLKSLEKAQGYSKPTFGPIFVVSVWPKMTSLCPKLRFFQCKKDSNVRILHEK